MSTEEETCTCIPATDACSACRPDAHAQRDELADLIASVTIDTKSGDVLRVHPDGETPVFEGDQRTADAILAAGYRKPRQVTTVEELDALPVESIVRDENGFAWDKWWDDDGKDYNWWATTGDRREYSAKRVALPATVLYSPVVAP